MNRNGTNGHIDLDGFQIRQEERFESLEQVLKNGFDTVANELKQMREGGHIPISVMHKIIDCFRPVFKTLCITIILLTMWLTGVKNILPHVLPSIFPNENPTASSHN